MSRLQHALPITLLLLFAACDLLKGGQSEKQPDDQKDKANAATLAPDTKPNKPDPTGVETPKADPSRSVPDPFDARAALDLIYQDTPGASWGKMDKDAQGKAISPPLDVLYFQGAYGDLGETKLYVKETARYPFTQKGKERLLFLMESAPTEGNDAHASSVTVGAAVFTRVGDRWQLDAAQKEIEQNGELGVGNVGKLVQIGPDRYGILLPDGYANQGLTTNRESLYDIAEAGFPKLFELQTHEDNSGNCSDDPKEREEYMMLVCFDYSAKLEFVPGKDPTYHDLKVTYTGTKEGETEAVKADKEERYTIKDGKYQR